MGSQVDNVRLGTLKHNFPNFYPDADLPEVKDEWQKKIALDLAYYKTNEGQYINPETVIIFPRIEQGWSGFFQSPVGDKRKLTKLLFDNISQKIAETVILYDRIPITGLDNRISASNRLITTEEFVQHKSIIKTVSILSNPRECWGDLID